ncbi:peptide chain release factor 3, partial [Massilicoli timonensis]|nr:peptide chain release factor 3 [Massilicoli timonensis]
IGMEEIIVGGVGVLQFDVLEQRLKSEYNVDINLDLLPFQCVRWIENEELDPNALNLTSESKRGKDLKGRNLIIFA